jgi:hypothetical protein
MQVDRSVLIRPRLRGTTPLLAIVLAIAWAGCTSSPGGGDASDLGPPIDTMPDGPGDVVVDVPPCPGALLYCSGTCVDGRLDPAHCGSCGHACAMGEVCSSGACGLLCTGGSTMCGATCVDIRIDPANCGSCGHACATGEVCSAGTCGLTCVGGSTLCGTTCADTRIDATNCGSCGHACATGEVCSAGTCGLTCVGGSTRCGTT